MASKLKVGRTSSRKALDRLEAEGRVWRHVGRGTFVGQRPPQRNRIFSLITAQTSPAEVLETRLLIEPQIARMAATKASEVQISELNFLVNKGRTANDALTWELWDSKFHRTLCTISENRLILSIFDGFNAIRDQPKWSALRTSVLTAERRAINAQQHQSIVDAITARNPSGSQNAMNFRIDCVARDLFWTAK